MDGWMDGWLAGWWWKSVGEVGVCGGGGCGDWWLVVVTGGWDCGDCGGNGCGDCGGWLW